MTITFIQTGGTIDKDYLGKVGSYNFSIDEPAVKRVLARIDLSFEYEVLSCMKKDSLDMTNEDRIRIKKMCETVKGNRIIITHGTDTMVQTAKVLSPVKGKTIVLTGSMLPERFKGSDADFNLGVAVGAVASLGEGVYIAMGGRIFRWDNVEKHKVTGQFIELVKKV